MLHILLGAGFCNIILFYAFTDGVRFLRSNFDKVLYLMSCLLQKPILLPVLLPSRFRSRIAVKHLDTHTIEITKYENLGGRLREIKKQVQPTNFLMAVQETNFLYSMTLSGFIAASVTCTMLLETTYEDDEKHFKIIMLCLAVLQFTNGLFTSFTLFGRKTDFLRKLRKKSIGFQTGKPKTGNQGSAYQYNEDDADDNIREVPDEDFSPDKREENDEIEAYND